MKELILASASPRRREMLQMLGLPFRVKVADVDESCGETDPEAYALAACRKKAEAVAKDCPKGQIVIACDTVVALENEILGKPKDRADARRMLKTLSGKEHRVVSALSVTDGEKTVSQAVATAVLFRSLAEDEIEAYLKTGECDDKAGAYGIQGLGGMFVSEIRGDWYTVVGMPLATLTQILKNEFSYDFFAIRAESEGKI